MKMIERFLWVGLGFAIFSMVFFMAAYVRPLQPAEVPGFAVWLGGLSLYGIAGIVMGLAKHKRLAETRRRGGYFARESYPLFLPGTRRQALIVGCLGIVALAGLAWMAPAPINRLTAVGYGIGAVSFALGIMGCFCAAFSSEPQTT